MDQWKPYPDKTWWLHDVPETGVDPVDVAGFSSRQLPGQYLDVVSTGRYLLLPYPCAQLYKEGQVISSTNVRTCASKATPDNAHAAPFQYLFISGTSFSAPTIAGVAALRFGWSQQLVGVSITGDRSASRRPASRPGAGEQQMGNSRRSQKRE